MTGTSGRTRICGVFGGFLAAAVLGLAACDDQPYPAPPSAGSASALPSPSDVAAPSATGAAPIVAEVPAPPPPAPLAPAAPSATPDGAPDAVVAMAPIPNPGDPGSATYYPTAAPPPRERLHPRPEPASTGALQSATTAPAGAPFVRSRRAERARAARMLQAQPRRAAVPSSSSPSAPAHRVGAKSSAATALGVGPAASPAAGLTTLQSRLTERVQTSAVLSAPDDPLVGRPFEATLSLPEGFADAVRAEAQKDGLGSQAVSATLSATLAGGGYSVTPAEVQTTPLSNGQAVAFHWTVTRLGQPRGPLQASLSGALLGGSTTPLTLGAVQKDFGGGSAASPTVVAVALLVLFAALVAAWLGRSRRRSRPSEVRRPTPAPPLDMTGEGPRL